MAKVQWNRPMDGGILYTPPDDFVLEKDKDAQWFIRYARWIVSSFYNQSRVPFHNEDRPFMGMSEEAIRNWSYIFQKQKNRLKYITQDFNNQSLPAVWEPGGKVASLYDHLSGILLKAIEDINVTATNLSKDVTSYRSELKEKLMIQWELKEAWDEMMPEGISYDPLNDPTADLSSPAKIEEYTTRWQDKYSIIAEKIGRAQLFMDDLKEKFLRDGQHQMVGGISGILTQAESGQVTNDPISNFELIWDNRQDDPFGNKAQLCGYVKHNVPYLEVIRRYRDQLSEEDVEEIRRIAASGYSNIDDFVSYYNTGFGVGNRYNWWNMAGTSQMSLAIATVYFIAPKDFRFKKGNNRFGAARISKINDNETYKVGDKLLKGVDIRGDYEGFDLHQATIIANKYIVGYGYAQNVIREHTNKGKIILPITTFCSNMVLNQTNSIISKLAPMQDKLDMFAYKIDEKTANDWGNNYVFNGNKFPGRVSVDEASELKRLHVIISEPSGESDDPYAAQKMVEKIDMTLDSNIVRYIELRREIMSEMDMITSVSRIALGQQGAVIGKGVQENTINQNSYGTATLMWGMMKHFNQVLQYNVNLKQLLYQQSDSVQESLVIGDAGAYLLDIADPKEFGTQILMVYMDLMNKLDDAQRNEIRTIALSQAQNGQLDLVDYIEHVLLSPTTTQAIAGLKEARNRTDEKNKERMAAESVMATEQQQAIIAAQTQAAADMAQLKEDSANYRAEISAAVKNLESLRNFMATNPAPPPSALQGQGGEMMAQEDQMMPQEQE